EPIYTAITIVGVIAVVLGLVAYLILAERKVSAWVQDRKGPNRVGPGGMLQPIADGGKMFLKEDIVPSHVDKVFYLLAPSIALATALLAIAVVPFGSTVAPPKPIPRNLGELVDSKTNLKEMQAREIAAFDAAQTGYRSHYSF